MAAFLDTFRLIDQHGTRRTYGNVLRQVQAAPVLDGKPVAALDDPATAEKLRGWFTDKWGEGAPTTWNRNRAALRAAVAYWQTRKWITTDPTTGLNREKVPPNRTRARGRTSITTLLERKTIPLRERTLWSLLYESTARAEETLLLDIGDLDLPNRRAVVHRKGGATDEITWQTRTARLLARYIAGRTRGPVFLTSRAARVQLAAADLDPETGRARLSYRRAEELFKEFSGGWTLHDLRHSGLTHAAEDGMPTPLLMAKSGHASIRSLGPYARPSIEAVTRWHDERDPATRRRGTR